MGPAGCSHVNGFKVENWKQNLRVIYQCFVWSGSAETRKRKVNTRVLACTESCQQPGRTHTHTPLSISLSKLTKAKVMQLPPCFAHSSVRVRGAAQSDRHSQHAAMWAVCVRARSYTACYISRKPDIRVWNLLQSDSGLSRSLSIPRTFTITWSEGCWGFLHFDTLHTLKTLKRPEVRTMTHPY